MYSIFSSPFNKSVFQTLEPEFFQIHTHTTSDFCYGALGIIWHVTGYFVTKLRLCICDAAPCSNTLFKAVDTNQKIAFVSHTEYHWTLEYLGSLRFICHSVWHSFYSKESRWTVSTVSSFLPSPPWLLFLKLCQFQLQVKYHFTISLNFPKLAKA